jgi:CRP/FNR family transcriptional regulator, cyclic AMP receptor protein
MAKTDPVLDLLASVDLFAELNRKELAMVRDMMKPQSFRAGQNVVTEGDASARFYLITKGRAAVVVGSKRLRSCNPGDHFGEIAVLDGGKRSATVVADTDLETLTIAPFAFRPLLRSNATITYKLLLAMCARLRETDKRLYTG